jgi:teichuronic acid biosynthesis glycosyltransferase TuaG
MPPLVSVVMPAFNAGRHIAQSIESVLGQTFGGWELIVVDDGSTDDTAEVSRRFAAADGRVRYFRRTNGGQAAARNTGLAHARGRVVAFLDADDLWLPDKLAAQVAVLEESGADFVYCDGYVFSDDGADTSEKHFHALPGPTPGAEMFRTLFGANHVGTLTVLVRRAALDAVGLFDEGRAYQNCEDYDLWLRLAKHGARFYGMTERLVRYRRHAAASTYAESNVLRPMLAVLQKHGRDPALDPTIVRKRIRDLYRGLAEALVREGKVAEAGRSLEEFAAWERSAVTRAQRLVLKVWPRGFNFISRECLFRIEWHVNRVLGR